MTSNILVVMDIKPDRLTVTGLSLLREAIESFGCNSVVARDSFDALQILQSRDIDAVLCTLGLYDATAFDLLLSAKAQDLVNMPFIVVTVSQTPVHDKILSIGCESTGAVYFNLGNYDSVEEMRQELRKRLKCRC
jgi:DNA-binding NtrC family response regulator